ncbi:hypothetical protein IT411_03980, partial [Candidatus Peregrinibacteria bacterium]|nr:hypothetical protein [Candidatus Peregrinibacteria bacterium]
MLVSLFGEISSAQVFSEVNMQMRIVPTSVEVTPAVLNVAEGAPSIQYTAIAKYEYPSLIAAIPDKDVTNDPLTVWSSTDSNVALVNTVGLVTPVSDLGSGNAPASIRAIYGGITGQAAINVTGTVVAPPSGGGGGGSGGFGQGPTQGGEPFVPTGENQPTENPPGENPPVENPPTENPPTENGGEVPGETTSNPPEEGGTNPAGEGGTESGGQTVTNSGGEVPVDNFGVTLPRTSVLPLETPVTPAEQITEEELFPPTESIQEGGVSRAYVVAKIANDLNVLKLRKATLDRCYADLANCTNIFRMFSSYQGITLDEDNLKLFPDVVGLKQTDEINKMALLGVIQG